LRKRDLGPSRVEDVSGEEASPKERKEGRTSKEDQRGRPKEREKDTVPGTFPSQPCAPGAARPDSVSQAPEKKKRVPFAGGRRKLWRKERCKGIGLLSRRICQRRGDNDFFERGDLTPRGQRCAKVNASNTNVLKSEKRRASRNGRLR